MSLIVCASCSRHVRETSCPFCGADLVHAPAVTPSRIPRIALVTAAAAVVAASACGTTTPLYGGPPVDASSVDAAKDASTQQDAVATFYGGPPIDSGLGGD